MRVIFYRATSGREPVREYLESLSIREQAEAVDALKAIQEYGFQAPGIRFRRARGKLWEFRIEGERSHRMFYVTVTGPVMVLLHAYKKERQKAPLHEIRIAEQRMREALSES